MKLRFYEKLMIGLLERLNEKVYKMDVAPEGLQVVENIAYVSDENERHLLDIIYPRETKTRYPVIVNIHGGGGGMNSKDKIYRNYGLRLAENGFAVINMNYRLVFNAPFPAQIEDVLSVLRFINTNADKYSLDRKNIFMVGDSAGAYFAAYTVCALTNKTLGQHFEIDDDMTVKAVALNCGPYDFNHFLSKEIKFPLKKMTVSALFGSRDFRSLESFQRSSVLDYVNSDFCPAYVMDAEKMSFVPQAKMLCHKLSENKVRYESRFFPKETKLMHSFHIESRYPESQQVINDTWNFFKEQMK